MFRSIVTIFYVTSLAVVGGASEPHRRTKTERSGVEENDIKATFSIEKNFECKGSIDKKNGARKKCQAEMKKKASIGLYASGLAKEIATDMESLHHSVVPGVDSFLPMDDTMAKMVQFDDDANVAALEDGYSTTVGFGGHFTAEWGCNITFSKNLGKLSKLVTCGVKSTEGSSMGSTGADAAVVIDEKNGREF